MPIRDKGRGGSPGQELKNFTDRDDELTRFQRLLALEEPAQLPALMFYGVGGTGKSWLLKRFREWLAGGPVLPSAYVDFDRRSGGPSYASDFSNLLAEIWRQLDVECPRFETAYAWMRFKQGAGSQPLVRHSGKVSTIWEFVKEGTSAGLGWVPGFNLIVWATDKFGRAAVDKLARTSMGEHLLSRAGQDDHIRIGRMTAQEIYPTLTERLGEDLDEQLPKRQGKRCRAVVLLDTFEDLAGGESNEARRQVLEEPVRELYRHLTCVLLVLFGRDKLAWDNVDVQWGERANLEQALLGGLSRHDATAFLGKCGIGPGPLLEAILRVSRDEAVRDREEYYPFALGLCADTVVAARSQGVEPAPGTFDMAPGDYGALAQRFLKSLHDNHPESWITHLAQTPRFDETAARATFSPARDVHQDEAWESLPDYSFVQGAAEPGWLRIHSVMSDVFRRRLVGEAEEFSRVHKDWRAHWQSRAQRDDDEFAALAWYHDYVLDPQQALSIWKDQAEKARGERDMTSHLALIDWWAPTEIEQRASKTPAEANALTCLGVELSQATLGSRTLNLRRAIACYESALQVYTEADFPSEWAMTQNNLGAAHSELPTGVREENLGRAIECCEAALRVWTESDFPAEWARTQNNLGIAYGNLPTGDRGENLGRAIACSESTLRVFTEADFPLDWAKSQNNLGNAYSILPTGDGSENLRRAIVYYESTLRILTESDFPSDWAKSQNNLGNVYYDLPTGDRSENLRRAIECYEAALRVRTESDYPEEWARTQNNLGRAYGDLPTGDRGENLRRAIACYEAALRILTAWDFPLESALTQHNLGNTYRNLPTGKLAENLRCAINCFEAALSVQTERDCPWDWAMTQNSLGTTYGDLPTGDRGENLRRAVECYEAALRVWTESDYPEEWARIHNNLGIAYYGNFLIGYRGENLRRAIECFEAALRVRTESDYPWDWAATQNNLGIAYRNSPTGDRGENLRRAIECYEAALRVRTESDCPWDWATTQNNLGNVYYDLPTDEHGENLHHALACFESALRVFTEVDFPSKWATTQNNLGNTYSNLPNGDQGENLRRSIACYESALRVYTEAGFPWEWAMTQNNLGAAYGKLPMGDRGENLRRAIASYEAALRVRTEADFPSDWAMTQLNLGLALRGEKRLDESVQAFECAARGYEAIGARSDAKEARMEAEKSRRAKAPSTET